jgi:hypothetical protein
MPESGLSGSVRGVPSNGHPYREPGPIAVLHALASGWSGRLASGHSHRTSAHRALHIRDGTRSPSNMPAEPPIRIVIRGSSEPDHAVTIWQALKRPGTPRLTQ